MEQWITRWRQSPIISSSLRLFSIGGGLHWLSAFCLLAVLIITFLLLKHIMGQIIKSLASFNLSAHTLSPLTVAIFVLFLWNFAQRLGPEKNVFDRGQNPMTLSHNALSIGRSENRRNKARGPSWQLRAQMTRLGSNYMHKVAKCRNPQFCP